jgi:hypothetical protein
MNPCRRCHGFVYMDLDDTRCIQCGDRPLLALRVPDDAPRKQGAFLPVVVETRRT